MSTILQTALSPPAATSGIASATGSNGRLTSGAVIYVARYAYDGYQAAYDAASNQWGVAGNGRLAGAINGWSGSVTANAGDHLYAAPLWANGATIPAPASARNIFTANAAQAEIPFEWSQLRNDPLVTAAGLTESDVAAVRNNPLGDIVNSQLAFVGRPSRLSLEPRYATFAGTYGARVNVIYVGANDGMLHGFDAGQGTPDAPGTGKELMAYVPRGLLGKLHADTFANAGYAHRYWVDGSPFSGDARIAAPDAANTANPGGWATVLVGTLGAGGAGYFVLDVTHPAQYSAAGFAGSVLIDATDTHPGATGPTAAQLPFIGNQFSPPVMEMYTTNQPAQIVRINTTDPNGDEWAVIMGNGYNSASGLPVLLIQSLSHPGRPLYTVAATCTSTVSDCVAKGNGLGAPRPIDVDGNGTADIVYAGDLLGNLWKFDISNPDHALWKVAHVDGGGQPAPMFTAVGPSGAAQPITSAPVVVPHPNGGFMVAFGTGKNLTDADATDTRLNSVYALYDNAPMTVDSAVTLPGLNTPVSEVLLLPSTQDQTKARLSPVPANCRNGSGPARYGCLYQQSGGAISSGTAGKTATGVTVATGLSSTLTGEQIDDRHAFGWYYDIPLEDSANGSAAKVLENPLIIPGNILMFTTQNAASSTGTSDPAGATESCHPATVNGMVKTENFFNLFTGNPADNTITLGNLTYNAKDGTNKADRFRLDGVTAFIANGPDAWAAVGQNIDITSTPRSAPAGRRAGWHIGR